MQAEQVVLGVNLVIELVAAAIGQPGEKLTRPRPEGHGGEEGKGRIFARVVAGSAPHGVDRTGLDGIEALEHGNKRVRLIELDGQVAVGHIFHDILVAGGDLAHDRELGPEGALHFPAHFLRFGVARRAERRSADKAGCSHCKEFSQQGFSSLVPQ